VINRRSRVAALLPHFPLPPSPHSRCLSLLSPSRRSRRLFPFPHLAAKKRIDHGRGWEIEEREKRCRGQGIQGGRRLGVVTGDVDLRCSGRGDAGWSATHQRLLFGGVRPSRNSRRRWKPSAE
uniref:Uncharacterized protein n=1 Tax=Aegilops tauschii subsp. strangulata TaxID=200361 RepID=A0A453M7H6_AEGTS